MNPHGRDLDSFGISTGLPETPTADMCRAAMRHVLAHARNDDDSRLLLAALGIDPDGVPL